jgi:pyruvate dehydrogenase E2 component (dihydrolipoamide acetyltransferase)
VAELTPITVPDIGDFDAVPVIEILVSPGDRVAAEDPLLTLESDKATMDVPAPAAGVISEIKVAVGDTVSQGTVIMLLDGAAAESGGAPARGNGADRASAQERGGDDDAPAQGAREGNGEGDGEGDGDGDGDGGARKDAGEAPRATLPAASAAHSDDTARGAGDEDAAPIGEEMGNKYGASAPDPRAPSHRPSPTATLDDEAVTARFHATPAIRRFARDLGVELGRVHGTGRKGRILREDVQGFVKQALSAPAAAARSAGGIGIEPIPTVDFSKFGAVEERKLSRIKRISGPFLHRAWLNVPHVTHHDEADVTELEDFRQTLKAEAEKKGLRITALTFIMKAAAKTLAQFPNVNASLSPGGDSLILKQYFNIGIAVDTPDGLVVPVFRDVDKKGVFELAQEMAEVSARARDGKLRPDDMQGGCFSISSLGGIGGTAFTPIVNAPEVAILGVTRARMQPVWNGSEFAPRLMLPLDLSYDHRVVDGAEAARFVAHLGALLSDLRRLLL